MKISNIKLHFDRNTIRLLEQKRKAENEYKKSYQDMCNGNFDKSACISSISVLQIIDLGILNKLGTTNVLWLYQSYIINHNKLCRQIKISRVVKKPIWRRKFTRYRDKYCQDPNKKFSRKKMIMICKNVAFLLLF